jgi:hypothetical protein
MRPLVRFKRIYRVYGTKLQDVSLRYYTSNPDESIYTAKKRGFNEEVFCLQNGRVQRITRSI